MFFCLGNVIVGMLMRSYGAPEKVCVKDLRVGVCGFHGSLILFSGSLPLGFLSPILFFMPKKMMPFQRIHGVPAQGQKLVKPIKSLHLLGSSIGIP